MSAADLVVNIDRVLPASPDTVFRALTDPALFGRWMGPEGSEVAVDEMEVTLGGRLAFRVRMSDGSEFSLYGFYEDIDPPVRLVHTWALVGEESGISTVIWELEPAGSDTRVRLTHHGLTTPEDIEQNTWGWNHQLDRLEAALAEAPG